MYPYNYDDQDPHHRQPQLFDDTSAGGYQYQHQGYGGGNGYSNSYNYNNPQQSHPQQSYSQAPFQPPQSSFQPPQNSALGSAAFPAAQFIKDPFIANAAMQYGQNLVGQGQQFIDQNLEKYMSVSKVKYYFAVDTRYVMKKIQLIFFPFAHSSEGVQVQPRHDVNAPDLYIPTMAFVTYILVAGLSLGLMNRFSPDALGMQASSAVVWLVLEVCCVMAALHLNSGAVVRRPLHAFHVLALAGYKFPGMIVMLAAGMLLPGSGYYVAQFYCSAALALFMFRTLRSQIQSQPGADDKYSSYGEGSKRRFYLVVFLTLLQPLFMWWLTRSVVYSPPANLTAF
ncbi:protein YIF1B-B-like isoform X2 [Hyalella azteca]|uniref:Protein YIF1 n=1 Tax=Hyalella azteca TaxID=294128 RepID=A0A979FSM9_HYAAZ|nr:protein YIF1B-B-like isoform X2 [Hyalella azteca]